MKFDAKKFLKDYNISYNTEGSNCQEGWINITCPFCNDISNHGGFNLEKGYYNCWKCKHHHLDNVVSALLSCNVSKAKQIIKEYESFIPAYTEKSEIFSAQKKAVWDFYFFLVEWYEINPESSQIDFTYLIQLRDAMIKEKIKDSLSILSEIIQLHNQNNNV